MSMSHSCDRHLDPQRGVLIMIGLLAALPIHDIATGDEPAAATQTATVHITATVVPPAPRLTARTTGEAVLIEADVPATVEKQFTLVPTGEGQWTLVVATYDGTMLATYQYPLCVGSLPAPTPPNPQPEPTPAPPLSALAKVALDAALETVPAEGRGEEAAKLAGAIDGVLKRCEADYLGADKLSDPAALRSALPAATAKALGKGNDHWIGWAEKVAIELDRLQAAGELADLAAYREAYRQITRGLQEVK